MNTYRVNHVYASTRDGVHFGPWTVGQEVQLSSADAAWMNRDSSGVLTLVSEGDEETKRLEEDREAVDKADASARDLRDKANRVKDADDHAKAYPGAVTDVETAVGGPEEESEEKPKGPLDTTTGRQASKAPDRQSKGSETR